MTLKSARAEDAPEGAIIHPHGDVSHEHSHEAVDDADNRTTVTHTHAHNHDDKSLDHQSTAHGHGTVIDDLDPNEQVDGDGDADDGFVVDADMDTLSAKRHPATYRPAEMARAVSSRVERDILNAVEIRAGKDGKRAIFGHAAVFNTIYSVNDFWMTYTEKCAPGCFAKTIKEADIRCLFNHDPNILLGRTKNGTLMLSEDDVGLAYEASPPDTIWANSVMNMLERGDVDQSSMGFVPIRETWGTVLDPDGDQKNDVVDCRTLLEVHLYDVSPVTYAASPTTDSAVRAALTGAGFDLESLQRVVIRSHRGMILNPRDRETVRASVDYLRRLLPVEQKAGSGAPVRTDHPPTTRQPPAIVAPAPTDYATRNLYAELDLLERQITKG